MGKDKQSVESFLFEVRHPQADIIEAVRKIIHQAVPELQEGIKWNAPSYSLEGKDIITFNFRNFGGVALIFHTGPKGKDSHTGTVPWTEVLSEFTWIADKRGVLKIPDLENLRENQHAIATLLRKWVDYAHSGFLP